jgi:AraC family transcriptional regulator
MAAIEIRRLPDQLTITTRIETTIAGIDADFEANLPLVDACIGEFHAPVVGPPFARFHDYSERRVEIELGAPIAAVPDGLPEASGLPDGRIGVSALPGGEVAATIHEGPYETIAATHERIRAWIAGNGLVAAPGPWEVYITDPDEVADPADYLTEVVWPLG